MNTRTADKRLSKQLKNWLERAIANDTSRPVLTWGCVRPYGDDVIAMSCDGYRMHIGWVKPAEYADDTIDFDDTKLINFDGSWLGFSDRTAVKYPDPAPAIEKVARINPITVSVKPLYQRAVRPRRERRDRGGSAGGGTRSQDSGIT